MQKNDKNLLTAFQMELAALSDFNHKEDNNDLVKELRMICKCKEVIPENSIRLGLGQILFHHVDPIFMTFNLFLEGYENYGAEEGCILCLTGTECEAKQMSYDFFSQKAKERCLISGFEAESDIYGRIGKEMVRLTEKIILTHMTVLFSNDQSLDLSSLLIPGNEKQLEAAFFDGLRTRMEGLPLLRVRSVYDIPYFKNFQGLLKESMIRTLYESWKSGYQEAEKLIEHQLSEKK